MIKDKLISGACITVAARTYSLRRITDKNTIDAKSIGQSYLSKDEMRERWGDNYITFYS